MNYVKSLKVLNVEARQLPCIPGSGAPTAETVGAVGDLYMDADSETQDIYKCVAAVDGVYTWEPLGGGLSEEVVDEKISTALDDWGQNTQPETQINKVSDIDGVDEIDAEIYYPNVKAVKDYVGDTEASLDGIIAQQESIIAEQNGIIEIQKSFIEGLPIYNGEVAEI